VIFLFFRRRGEGWTGEGKEDCFDLSTEVEHHQFELIFVELLTLPSINCLDLLFVDAFEGSCPLERKRDCGAHIGQTLLQVLIVEHIRDTWARGILLDLFRLFNVIRLGNCWVCSNFLDVLLHRDLFDNLLLLGHSGRLGCLSQLVVSLLNEHGILLGAQTSERMPSEVFEVDPDINIGHYQTRYHILAYRRDLDALGQRVLAFLDQLQDSVVGCTLEGYSASDHLEEYDAK